MVEKLKVIALVVLIYIYKTSVKVFMTNKALNQNSEKNDQKHLQEYPVDAPQLGVYRSNDGSIYSKPEEVQNLLNWIKRQSDLKSGKS